MLPRRQAPSCLPFPPTTAQKFGLIQEELADEPLNLLSACMLLNKTKGIGAIPKFWELMERYPTSFPFESSLRNFSAVSAQITVDLWESDETCEEEATPPSGPGREQEGSLT
ncbi:uncharacterized protein BKA78DRAFT_300828 [Phyllosticta capitalensis]|uniref:Pentatricopeptide repeat-containing protein n=1 Tax=Phyllosticta capitalensis TaxID=121624 RepID=A0ABR1Y8U9_9PEZI